MDSRSVIPASRRRVCNDFVMWTLEWSAVQQAPNTIDLASEPAITEAELLSLAVNRDPAVRAMVAEREDCPVGALISLAHDHRAEVLIAVVANPRTPSSVIRNLADHRFADVASAAERRLRGIAR
jgi:hypothetical protein